MTSIPTETDHEGELSVITLSGYQNVALGGNYAYGIKYNSSKGSNEYWKIDLTTGSEEFLVDFSFSSGGWYPDTFDANETYIGSLGSAGDYKLFSIPDNRLVTLALSSYQSMALGEAYAYGNNCLLYTSPSPRDGLLSRMPSSA